MLDKKQIEAIELLCSGDYTKAEIASNLGVHRTTVYNWLDNQEFMATLDKRLSDIKTNAKKEFISKLPVAIQEYWKICTTCTDVRTKEKALANWIERSLGRIENTINVNTEKPDGDIDVLAAMEQANIDVKSE